MKAKGRPWRPWRRYKRRSSCVFQAYGGKDFDVEAFLRRVPWRPHRVRCAEWLGPGHARESGFNLIVTRVSRDRPKAIVAAAQRSVVANRRHIERVGSDPRVTYLALDFAICFPNLTPDPQILTSEIRFSPKFLALLARLGIELVASVYARPQVRRRSR